MSRHRSSLGGVAKSAVARLSTNGTGGVLIVTVIMSLSESPPASVTDAVIVCVPTLSVDVEKPAPEPMLPSRSDDHDRLTLISPSSVSFAVPVKFTVSPAVNVEPLAGAVIDTVGAVFAVTLSRTLSSWK